MAVAGQSSFPGPRTRLRSLNHLQQMAIVCCPLLHPTWSIVSLFWCFLFFLSCSPDIFLYSLCPQMSSNISTPVLDQSLGSYLFPLASRWSTRHAVESYFFSLMNYSNMFGRLKHYSWIERLFTLLRYGFAMKSRLTPFIFLIILPMIDQCAHVCF